MYKTTLLLLVLPCWLAAKELVICGTIETPLKWLNSAQQPQGLDIDIVTTIFKSLNVPINIKLTNSGARLTRDAQTGACDMVLSHSYKVEREAYLIYPKQAHLLLNWYFFIRKTDIANIHYNTLADLKPWRIGITKAFSYTPELTALRHDPNYQFQEIPLNQLQLRKLLAHRVDVVPMQFITALAQIKSEGWQEQLSYLPQPLKSSPYFNAWSRASINEQTRDLMERYDAQLLQMKRDGRLNAIYQRYDIPYIEP